MKVLIALIAVLSATQAFAAQGPSVSLGKATCVSKTGNNSEEPKITANEVTIRKLGKAYIVSAAQSVAIDQLPKLTPSKETLMSIESDRQSKIEDLVIYQNSVVMISSAAIQMRVMYNSDSGAYRDASVRCAFDNMLDVQALDIALKKL